MITIRPLRLPEDLQGILGLDTSFETDRIYRVEIIESSFQLVETSAKVKKKYTLDTDELARLSAQHFSVVASIGSEIAGLAAAEYVDWNRRVILHHLYVARDHRRSGIGGLLLQSVTAWSRTTTARCLWLETQNVNIPAIRFYRRAGFSLSGFDASLYDSNNVDPREVGIFFSKPLD
jgi:GNAT superfamily N-acetyltransferase